MIIFPDGQSIPSKGGAFLLVVNRNYRTPQLLRYHVEMASPFDGIGAPADQILG